MKNILVQDIIKKKIPCVFISPHYDDVILSCGGLLLQLAGKTNLTVINVFTAVHSKPYTLSARRFINLSGHSDAATLFKERQKEDQKVLSQLPISIVDFGFEEALFRKKKKTTFFGKILPEIDHIYPTYRWHILKKTANDDYAVVELRKKLQKFRDKKILIFAPVGIGNHVDHVITSNVCREFFDNLILYSDFPYNIRLHTDSGSFKSKNMYKILPDKDKKNKLLKGYTSQFFGLFPGGIVPHHEEVYFSNKEL